MTLDEDGEAFVEPEAFPIAASDGVSGPGVSHFVSSDVHLRLVTDNNSGRSEGQERVLHAAHGEGRREDQDGVVTPDVGSQVGLSHVEVLAHVSELIGALGHLSGFSENSNTVAKRLVDNVTSSDSHQVVGNRDLAEEESFGCVLINNVELGLVRTHFDREFLCGFNSSGVGHFVAGGVLNGDDRSTVDILALRVHVGHRFTSSLGFSHPGHGVRRGLSLVHHLDGDRLPCGNVAHQFDDQSLAHADSGVGWGLDDLPGVDGESV